MEEGVHRIVDNDPPMMFVMLLESIQIGCPLSSVLVTLDTRTAALSSCSLRLLPTLALRYYCLLKLFWFHDSNIVECSSQLQL